MLSKSVLVVKMVLNESTFTRADGLINSTNRVEDTALIQHARHDPTIGNPYPSSEIICELLKHKPIDTNARNKKGESALVLDIEQRRVDVVQMLLNSGT